MGLIISMISKVNSFLGPLVMLLYPLYASIQAIESPLKEDDQQWLTYWVLYSLTALFELGAGPVLEWLPFWSTLKLIAACWLVLPQFQGAYLLYEAYVRPLFLQYSGNLKKCDTYTSVGNQRAISRLSADARTYLAQYISDNGHEAFERIISAACREGARGKSPEVSPNTKERKVHFWSSSSSAEKEKKSHRLWGDS